MVRGLPVPMGVEPQEVVYQWKMPPVPPVAEREMLTGMGPEQKTGVSTDAPVGEVGVGLTVTVTLAQVALTHVPVSRRTK